MTSDQQHFSTVAGGTPTASGRFVDVSAVPIVEMLPGLGFQPVLGEDTMVNFVSFEPNTEAPTHVHVEEQIVIVLDGEFEFWIDGESRTMRAGDVAVVPPGFSHGPPPPTRPAARSMSSTPRARRCSTSLPPSC